MRRALVVHDDAEVRDSVAAALRASGFEVKSAPATPAPSAEAGAGPWDAVVTADPKRSAPPAGWRLRPARKEWERRFIESAIAEHAGDKVKAARALGINLSSLYRKMSGDEMPEAGK